jgi:drug/metabolite transporter (DMT)-like permease
MNARRPEFHAFAMLGIVMLLWAGNSVIGRAVRGDIPPFTLALVRWSGALLLLLPFALRTLFAERARILSAWKIILILGLTGVGAFNALLYAGLRHTPATNALLLQAGIPALVLLFDRLLFGTRPAWLQVAGVTLSTLGVVFIVFEGDPAAAAQMQFGTGDLLVLSAVVAWAIYTALLRLRPDIAPLSFLAVTFLIGVLAMAPLAALEWYEGERIACSPGVLGAFAYVAVLPSLVAYILFNAAVAQIGPIRAGQTITLMPLFGAILSAALLGETLAPYHFAGMALILAGIVVTAVVSARTQTKTPLE